MTIQASNKYKTLHYPLDVKRNETELEKKSRIAKKEEDKRLAEEKKKKDAIDKIEAEKERKKSADLVTAWVCLQDVITNKLFSPDTADFPWFDKQEYAFPSEPGKYKINSYVSSQNRF